MRLYTVFAKHLAIRWPLLAIFAALMLGAVQEGYGQDQVRTYANFQGTHEAGINLLGLLTGSVTNDGNAIDGNVKTSSTLSVPVGVLGLLSATQFLEFTENGSHSTVRNIAAETPVTIKASFPREILGLLSNIQIGHYRNLESVNATLTQRAGYNTSDKTVVYSGASLLNLVNGTGEFEITFSPDQDYHGVFITLSGNGLSVLLINSLFHAYIMEDSGVLACDQRDFPIDVLSGTRSNAIGALTFLGGVTNPYNVFEGGENDYATMSIGVNALNTIYLNTIFPTASISGQKVRIILENPAGLLDLSLLSQFTIQPMLRNNDAGPPLDNTSSLLNLRLLPGTTKYELAYSINESFDRIELRFDNTVTALASLRVYEVSRSAKIMLIENPTVLQDSLTNCGQVNLSKAIANYQPDHYDYRYYTLANGGTPLPSSLVSTSGTYYIEAVDPVTGCASPRVPVTATVHPLPTVELTPIPAICEGETTTGLQFSNVTNGGNQYSITWDTSTPGLNNVPFTELPGSGEISFTGLENIPQGNYTGVLKVLNTTTGCESVEYPIELTITPLPGRASLSITNSTN